MLIRPAHAADAQRIAEIQVEAWRSAYRGQMSETVLDALSIQGRTAFWSERLAQPVGCLFVAEDESVIGFCDLIPSRDADADLAFGEIAAIYVLPGKWRQGAGRKLCETALAEAGRRGYEVVTLWSLASNHRAKSFYEAMGFSLDGARRTKKASDGSDLQVIRFRRRVA